MDRNQHHPVEKLDRSAGATNSGASESGGFARMEAAFVIAAIDAAAREATLFAAIWFLVGGLDDLAVDLLYLARRARARLGALTGRAGAARRSGSKGRCRRGESPYLSRHGTNRR
jgi:hypothetical protein